MPKAESGVGWGVCRERATMDVKVTVNVGVTQRGNYHSTRCGGGGGVGCCCCCYPGQPRPELQHQVGKKRKREKESRFWPGLVCASSVPCAGSFQLPLTSNFFHTLLLLSDALGTNNKNTTPLSMRRPPSPPRLLLVLHPATD